MNFADSTHKAHWLSTKDSLLEARQQLNNERIEGVKRLRRTCAGAEDSADAQASQIPPVTVEDEQKLLRYYQEKVVALCAEFKYPAKVKATALVYYKRFFLRSSCMDSDPAKMMLTCIYLAGKIEEAYIGAEEFCRVLKQDSGVVLRNEVQLLQGLSFELIVHSPYRALAGFLQDIENLRKQAADGNAASAARLDAAAQEASEEVWVQCKASSHSAVDALMLTDAPLLFPPGQLALAALRSGCRRRGVKLAAYFEGVAARAREQASPPDGGASPVQQLLSSLDAIDKLGMEGVQKVDVSEVQEIDKRLKAWRSPLLDPNSDASKAAAAASEKEKQEKREAKLRARKAQQAAEEAKLLGFG